MAAADDELPDPEADPDPASLPPDTAWQVPVGFASFDPCVVTSGPGCGKMTSKLAWVVQPFPTLATKMVGRELKGVESRFATSSLRFELPPAMVTLAQFMYISLQRNTVLVKLIRGSAQMRKE